MEKINDWKLESMYMELEFSEIVGDDKTVSRLVKSIREYKLSQLLG